MINQHQFKAFMLTILLLLLCCAARAQDVDLSSGEEDVMEDISLENEEEEVDWQDEIQLLHERMEEPLNLNATTKEQLEQFPFLSDKQIENILAYLYVNGPMLTTGELNLVKEMDWKTIHYLLPFVCVKTNSENLSPLRWNDVLKYGRHEILTRLDIPFYTRKGYRKAYTGPPLYHSLYYSFHYKDKVYAGLSGEKDAGEPFAGLYNKKGYDSYSFYFFMRDIGKIKRLAAGNYRLGFGQGLVVNSSFWNSKSALSAAFDFRNSGVSKQTSVDEYNFFRGIAGTVALRKNLYVSLFASYRPMDGVIEKGNITSIYTTGLHRTFKEEAKRNCFSTYLAGSNITYRRNFFQVGLTTLYYGFSKDYRPELKGYSKYGLQGNKFYNIGIDYKLLRHKWNLQGEVAKGKKGYACLNKFTCELGSKELLHLVHRFYTVDYWALYARSFSEGGRVQNENGWYLGVQSIRIPRCTLYASADFFSFPWKKYRISRPSTGMEGQIKIDYLVRKDFVLHLDYFFKQKDRDITGTKGNETNRTLLHRLRGRGDYQVGRYCTLRSSASLTNFQIENHSVSSGFHISQKMSCQLSRLPLSLTLQAAYFHTGDYDSRVYIAEKALYRTFYTPAFQGQGMRWYAHIRYDVGNTLMLAAKIGQTYYFDRSEIGQGNDLIEGNSKMDLQLQLRWKI